MSHFMTSAAKGDAIINLVLIILVKMCVTTMMATELCTLRPRFSAGHTLMTVPLLNHLFDVYLEGFAANVSLISDVFLVTLFRL